MRRQILLGSAAALVLGCTGDVPTNPAEGSASTSTPMDASRMQTMVLACKASRVSLSVECAVPPAVAGKGDLNADIIFGSQNVYVNLTTSNVAYDSGTGRFTFNTTVQNLIQQPIGTTDGTTQDPNGIRIFFASGPTVTGGTGIAAVVPDGFATFQTPGQAYYQYNQVLSSNATSSIKTWTLIMPPTVTSFHFTLLVSAPVQYPSGYIEINGSLPGTNLGNLHPGSVIALTGVIKNALGIVHPGTITWGTTDADQAIVDASGNVTGVRYGTPSITASGDGVNGNVLFNVTGTIRTWNGSASPDWFTGANWNGGYKPAIVDTAMIPAGTPNSPSLTAADEIGSLQVADNQVLNLQNFNLTLSKDASTGATGGGVESTTGELLLTGTGMFSGRFPLVTISGNYSQSADVVVKAPIKILGGTWLTQSLLTMIQAQ